MTEVGTRDIPPLNWDVLVTPGIPIATSDLPPGLKQAAFQAIASTLIYGKRDAVLVDAFMTVKQADDSCKRPLSIAGQRSTHDSIIQTYLIGLIISRCH
jgi:hypothetical protein